MNIYLNYLCSQFWLHRTGKWCRVGSVFGWLPLLLLYIWFEPWSPVPPVLHQDRALAPGSLCLPTPSWVLLRGAVHCPHTPGNRILGLLLTSPSQIWAEGPTPPVPRPTYAKSTSHIAQYTQHTAQGHGQQGSPQIRLEPCGPDGMMLGYRFGP